MKHHSCHCLFDSWTTALKDRPELWSVRDLLSGKSWHNAALANRFASEQHGAAEWNHRINLLDHKTAPLLEDAHSLALKTSEAYSCEVSIKFEPHHLTSATAAVISVRCDHCAACLILTRFSLSVSPAVEPDPIAS